MFFNFVSEYTVSFSILFLKKKTLTLICTNHHRNKSTIFILWHNKPKKNLQFIKIQKSKKKRKKKKKANYPVRPQWVMCCLNSWTSQIILRTPSWVYPNSMAASSSNLFTHGVLKRFTGTITLSASTSSWLRPTITGTYPLATFFSCIDLPLSSNRSSSTSAESLTFVFLQCMLARLLKDFVCTLAS